MDVFPAIDLQNGLCVRLAQGDFAASTIYEDDPLCQARRFADAGATWLHIVDLDGARSGNAIQSDVIYNIVQHTHLKVQVGGGIRALESAQDYLRAGAARVVIGSLAVKDPAATRNMMRLLSAERVVLAFDVRLAESGEPIVTANGWQNDTGVSLWQILHEYAYSEIQTIMCTDIARDGMLMGPNLDLYRALLDRYPGLDILASGGVKDSGDIVALREAGVGGVITGKALYENKLSLKDALTLARVSEGAARAG